jgi:hypothetical protein
VTYFWIWLGLIIPFYGFTLGSLYVIKNNHPEKLQGGNLTASAVVMAVFWPIFLLGLLWIIASQPFISMGARAAKRSLK